MTTLALIDAPAGSLDLDAVVLGVHAGDGGPVLAAGAESVDEALGGRLTETLRLLGATGTAGEVTKLATLGATPAPIVVAVGLGKDTPPTAETVRRAAGAAVRALAGSPRVACTLPLADPDAGPGPLLRAVAEGALLGAYEFSRYKAATADRKEPVQEVTLVVGDVGDAERAEVTRATAVAGAVRRTRDWVNTAPNDLRPPQFAEEAAAAAREAGLDVEVLDEDALRAGGYGGILAVGTGSTAPPRLVRISYVPDGDVRASVALIGKGITFDTGGISIKPAAGMEAMKSDMAGAAAVVAVLTAVAALRPAVAVTAWVPMAENMPSGTAYRPGDVVTMYGGKRVEVLNTDAEGRMILGDAIARAAQDTPDYLIETSTLTGGQVVALGSRVSGVMGTDEVCERVAAAGRRSGETMWPMPLPEEVRSGMDSAIADLSQTNAGGDRAGHMLQGGVFLGEFVPDGMAWAHIDIAGPSYSTAAPWGHVGKGGTGVPVRTLLELVEDIAVHG